MFATDSFLCKGMVSFLQLLSNLLRNTFVPNTCLILLLIFTFYVMILTANWASKMVIFKYFLIFLHLLGNVPLWRDLSLFPPLISYSLWTLVSLQIPGLFVCLMFYIIFNSFNTVDTICHNYFTIMYQIFEKQFLKLL